MGVRLPRAWSRLGRAAGHAVFRSRNVLAPATILLLIACSRPEDFLAPAWLDHWLDGCGIVAVVAGLAIRAFVLGTTGIRRSGIRRRVVAEILHDAGPYAWCRNPLYLGNATILAGLALVFDSRWMVGLALPAALVAIRSIVLAEERMLRDRFGARYHDYCRHVPRFVPRRPAGPPTGRRLDWRRALRKEHGTIFSAVTAAAIFALAEDHARAASAVAVARHTALVLGLWFLAAMVWTAIRLLKHRGRLSDLYAETTAAAAHDLPYSDAAA